MLQRLLEFAEQAGTKGSAYNSDQQVGSILRASYGGIKLGFCFVCSTWFPLLFAT